MKGRYLGNLGERRLLIRIMAFAGFLLGLVIYFEGFLAGFFQASALYVEYWVSSGTYALSQFLLFETYPRFLSILSPVFLVTGRFTTLTFTFLTFAFGALASIFLSKVRIAVFCSVSASLAAFTQCICILPFVGGEPLGLMFSVPSIFFIASVSIVFPILFSSKNLYLLIIPAMLFMAGMLILFFLQIREKTDLILGKPPSSMHFKILKSVSSDFGIILLSPMLIFLWASFFQIQIIQNEFPHYPILATFAHISPSNGPFLLIFWILYYQILLIILRAQKRALDGLAGQCIAILAKDWQKQKPVISLAKVMELLGLESADRRLLKNVLFKAAETAERDGTVYFGIIGNYIYFEYPN